MPLKHGVFQAGYVGGMNAMLPTLAAVSMRDFTNRGQHVDVSIAEALASQQVMGVPYYTYMGETPGRRKHASDCAEARDGWVLAHAARAYDWDAFCEITQAPELADARFDAPRKRVEHSAEVDRLLTAALKKRDRFDKRVDKWRTRPSGAPAELLSTAPGAVP